MDGRGGSEGAGGGGSVKKVRQVGRGEVVDGFKGMKEKEAIYITKMEVGSAGGDVDMGFEGE